MLYTLENNTALLSVDTYACEIHSFRRKDKDIEYMWNGDPAFWSGRNPVLFPHVSSPKNKILNFKGKDHPVNNHGFCRRSEFEFVKQSDKSKFGVSNRNLSRGLAIPETITSAIPVSR